MLHFTNSLDSSIGTSTLSKTNFMPSHHNESQPQPQDDGTNGNSEMSAHPVWDRVRRELRFGETVVKRFKWPAENQERVLDAFEENGWPRHINDPLEQHASICPKRRLHDTLKCLNRKQVVEAIKFRGDGTGLGVFLEIVRE